MAKKKAEPKQPKQKKNRIDLAKVATDLKSVLKEDHVVVLDDASLKESLPHISTGAFALDYLIGGRENKHGVRPCPGIPKGRMTMVYGNPGAGKTTIALQTCAVICGEGGTAIYVDWENEVDPTYASSLGVPISDKSRFLLVQPDTLEAGLIFMSTMAKEGVDLIVMDSIGAAVPKAQFEKQDGETMAIGLNARMWSTYLPKFKKVVKKYNTTVLAISQLRSKIGGMTGFGGPQAEPQGGKAWKFYNSLQIMLKVVGTEKGKVWNPIQGKYVESVIGSKVRAKLDKCKISSSLKNEIDFFLLSGSGVDNTRTVIELGISTGVIKKKGAWFYWQGPEGEVRSQGLPAFIDAVEDHIDSIFSSVRPYLSDPANREDTAKEVVEDDDSLAEDDLSNLLDELG
jgi:recombination protein RecA